MGEFLSTVVTVLCDPNLFLFIKMPSGKFNFFGAEFATS